MRLHDFFNDISVFDSIKRRIRGFFFYSPSTSIEDKQRRHAILNTALTVSITVSGFAFLINLLNNLQLGTAYRGASWVVTGSVFLFFATLQYLSNRGFITLASTGVLFIYLFSSFYASAVWGIDLPVPLLCDALLIIMTSVLFSSRAGIVLSFFISSVFFTLHYLSVHGYISVIRYWRNELATFWDVLAITVMFVCIAFLCRLANNEMEKSLKRAHESEALLREERDTLEQRVEERTKELRQEQLERINQLHRFAEFGRMASSYFHDLVNPLNAIALNLELLERAGIEQHKDASVYLHRATDVTKRLESFLSDVRRHIREEEESVPFDASDLIQDIIDTFQRDADKAEIRIQYTGEKPFFIFGKSLKFHKIVSNLVRNAVDSYRGSELPSERRMITVTLTDKKTFHILTVQDLGSGIAKSITNQIWEPFYTTKSADVGMGIGLTICKEIVERDFNGTISVNSIEGEGTIFTVMIPVHESTPTHHKQN